MGVGKKWKGSVGNIEAKVIDKMEGKSERMDRKIKLNEKSKLKLLIYIFMNKTTVFSFDSHCVTDHSLLKRIHNELISQLYLLFN